MIKQNAILEINKKNLIYNFNILSKKARKSITGATIKADAYGLGVIPIFKILYNNKCRHFFFATLEEALYLRKKNLKGNFYVLNGLENNKFSIFNKYKIIPILNSKEELQELKNSNLINRCKIGIFVETGLNRLGINKEEIINIKNKLNIEILISHLASSNEIRNNYNQKQNKIFKSYFSLFKKIKYKSLVSSMGILLGKNFHYDMIRPGISLYGGHYDSKLRNIIKPVIKLKAKVLQIKEVNKNQFIGYNQTYKTTTKIKVAVLGIGYADGLSRILSNQGMVMYKKNIFKIIGRISMDSIIVNISDYKKPINKGEYFEIINEKNNIEKNAKKCRTISNEILTSISKRVKRVYI